MAVNFDFECPRCEVVFEAKADVETDRIECPHCGCPYAGKKPSAPAFVVKGYNAKNGYANG